MKKAIKAEHLSKAYQLGDFGTGTISRDLERFWARMCGKEDPFLKIGEVNDRTQKGESDVVWSLKDLNFEIEQGDAIGVIGRNGAGKSTLLKVLSRVTFPTTGSIKVKGRIASLLEVGTGFHPELTGKENIYLNGTILGMRKAEIKRKFDEIVDFAGVERYIDTPVKRYSSGMYVRLAFAVAAHLESEILIVDEVLAVGDAEFQKKCLGKMGDISRGEGRTILFVSHNMGNIMKLCNKGMLLSNGQLIAYGDVAPVVNQYIASKSGQSAYRNPDAHGFFREVFFSDTSGQSKSAYLFNEKIQVGFVIDLRERIPELTLSIVVKDQYEKPIFSSHFTVQQDDRMIRVEALIPSNTLLPGIYLMEPVLHIPNVQFIEQLPYELVFEVEDSGGDHTPYNSGDLGNVYIPLSWK